MQKEDWVRGAFWKTSRTPYNRRENHVRAEFARPAGPPSFPVSNRGTAVLETAISLPAPRTREERTRLGRRAASAA